VRRLPVFALIVGVFGLISCHNYTAPTSTAITCTTTTSTTSTTTSSSSCTDPVTGISIGIAPPTVSVIVATPTQFQVGVSGGTNGNVTWQVNGMTGGNDTVGRIDSTGKYIAPSAVPSPATVTVGVVPSADPKLSVTSAVTILPPPLVTISPTCTPVAPCMLTSGTANKKTFTATVTGAPTTIVDWQVNGVLGGNGTFGTIDATGVYTAPNTPPIGSVVTVTAVSRDFPLSKAPATVTISGYSTSSFQGPFAFSMSGKNASGAFSRAGSFAADGAGHLNGGFEDVNAAACATTNPISFAGSYMIGTDGRGTMQFNDGCSPATFSFVLVNSSQLQIIGFDATGTATGQANSQDLSAFSASALSGTQVFDFNGVDNSSNPLSQIGEFTTDGQSKITSGLLDINDNGAPSQASVTGGSYAITSSTSGRGTATLVTSVGSLQFSFYIVSRGSTKFVGMNSTQRSAGMTAQQDPNATFDLTSLTGNYAFLLAGSGTGGTVATAGSFSADGGGNITSGVLDENVSSVPNPNVAFTGAYLVASSGRGTASFNVGRKYVFYLSSKGTAVFQETDSLHANIASDGSIVQQLSAAFSLAFNKGNNYAINTSGISGGAVQVIAGQLGTDGAGNITSGAIIDINSGGTLSSGQAVTGSYSAPVATGRTTLVLNSGSRTLAAYVVNSTQVYVVEIDATLAVGAMVRRF
jgi:hypothetical protein